MTGTLNLLDAGRSLGLRRVVALSTGTFFDLTTSAPAEEAPVLDDPPDDPYSVTKLAAFRAVHQRAAAGDDVLTCHPGAIYGPGVVSRRALDPTTRLGYQPMGLDDGLDRLIPWLRELGKL